jgi:preprotein translocase subunit YajC
MQAIGQFLPFILMFVVMYFFFILPKQREVKKTDEMRKALKKGDKVLTTAGIIGIVAHVEDHTVSLKTGDNVRLDFEKAAVIKLITPDAEK